MKILVIGGDHHARELEVPDNVKAIELCSTGMMPFQTSAERGEMRKGFQFTRYLIEPDWTGRAKFPIAIYGDWDTDALLEYLVKVTRNAALKTTLTPCKHYVKYVDAPFFHKYGNVKRREEGEVDWEDFNKVVRDRWHFEGVLNIPD